MTTRRWLEGGIAACGVTVLAVFALRAAGVEVVAEWLYLLAWVPTLLALDLLVVRLGGEAMLLRPAPRVFAMVWWSAVIWLVFEVINLRLRAWYYVYVPSSLPLRWLGTLAAFGTVVPAILLPERVLRQVGLWRQLRGPAVRVQSRDLKVAMGLGATILAAVLALPAVLHPLVWGAVWLLADPLLYRLRPAQSLIADVSRGEWGRVARLLVAGLIAGLIWEAFNLGARTKWIYTVPFLEEWKVFEMPVLGFLGFPFFALEVWSMYHLASATGARMKILVPSIIFAVLALAAMDRWTVSSTVPRLADLPEIDDDTLRRLRQGGFANAFRLAAAPLEVVVRETGLSEPEVWPVYAAARLATLRGIGTAHAAALRSAGYPTVEHLRVADPTVVWRRVGGGPRPTQAEVREWVRAARKLEPDGRFGGDLP